MQSSIVLDKNYLQGASQADVHALGAMYRLVMPGALFFELLTTDLQARQRCFAKLPQRENPVELVDNIGLLLAREMESASPAGPPSSHKLQIRFQFNTRLQNAEYALPSQAQDAIDEMTADLDTEIERLIDLSDQTPSLFPNILEGSAEARRLDHKDIQRVIADPDKMLGFYSVLKSPDLAKPYPSISSRPEQWALIRWLQVTMLFAVDLFVRYQGRLRASLTPAVRTRLEHDLHDA